MRTDMSESYQVNQENDELDIDLKLLNSFDCHSINI